MSDTITPLRRGDVLEIMRRGTPTRVEVRTVDELNDRYTVLVLDGPGGLVSRRRHELFGHICPTCTPSCYTPEFLPLCPRCGTHTPDVLQLDGWALDLCGECDAIPEDER